MAALQQTRANSLGSKTAQIKAKFKSVDIPTHPLTHHGKSANHQTGTKQDQNRTKTGTKQV
jgi:hypothetical protein